MPSVFRPKPRGAGTLLPLTCCRVLKPSYPVTQAMDSFFFFFPLQLFRNKWSDETFVSYKNECGSSVIARALLSFQSHIHSIPKYSVVKGGKQRYIPLAHKRGTNIFPSYLPELKNLLFLKYWKIIPRHFITYSRNLNGESCSLYANPIERSVS